MDEPIISVLIPTYNYAHLLDETIQSVLQQTYTDYELTIVDDNSTDNSIDVIQKYQTDPRVRLYRNHKGLGVAGNWNKCLEYARGSYIKMLCADDKLHPEILSRYVEVMQKYPSVIIVSCQKQVFSDRGKTDIRLPVTNYLSGKETIIAMARHDNFLGEPSLPMFRQTALEAGRFKDFNWIVDWEMWVRMLTKGDCFIILEVLCYARRHSGQATEKIKKFRAREIEEYQLFKRMQNGEYGPFHQAEQVAINQAVVTKAVKCAREMLKMLFQKRTPEQQEVFQQLYRIASTERTIFHRGLFRLMIRDNYIRLRKAFKSRKAAV